MSRGGVGITFLGSGKYKRSTECPDYGMDCDMLEGMMYHYIVSGLEISIYTEDR